MTGLKILLVCALDGLVGDPRWSPHPVRIMGLAIRGYERMVMTQLRGQAAELFAGIVIAIGLPLSSWLVTRWIIDQAQQFDGYVGHAVWIVLGYTSIAARDLFDHVLNVYRALKAGSLDEARQSASLIVGRDTEKLSEPEVIRASIETVAESTSDGVIAPLLYLAIGGPPLALAYKAVNTLDSMIGHRTETYRNFGWASARLDDVMNWGPARISGLCLVLAAGLRFRHLKSAWNVFLRDGGKHVSPNSGWPEAAMAGALQVQLGGINVYAGIPEERPKIGEPITRLTPQHLLLAVQLMGLASGLLLLSLVSFMGGW